MSSPEQSEEEISLSADEIILQLQKTREWLNTVMVDYHAKLESAKDSARPGNNIDQIQERITELQKELLDASTNLKQKEQIVKRMQLGECLSQNLLSACDGDQGAGDLVTRNKETESLLPLVQRQMELVTKILGIHKAMQTMHVTVGCYQKDRLQMMKQCRELLAQAEKQNEEKQQRGADFQQNEEIQDAKRSLEEECSKIEMQRHVLQGLILGSGIHWAEDEKLKKLVISLGQPLDL
ncbi:centromere protein H-like [Lingula anatina]|uniref:Centromere protein H-like n=1 Tax=Lingula anatina TaxID=7574 RepID=A0A1S3J1E3_LINAN|nr:centromere protein H-like [Lingula anatina]|eukprot:XP_013404265.1 centromere protein H-like [Lingula anatina]